MNFTSMYGFCLKTMQCRSLSGSGAQKKAENVIGVPKDMFWIEGKTKTEI